VSEFCSEKLRSLCCVRGLLLLLLRSTYDRGFAQKLRSLRCVRVSSSLLRPKLRSRLCAKVSIFVLYSCVVVVIAIELTIEILCKACEFLCGRACVRVFRFRD
jgi:hypothetical protein